MKCADAKDSVSLWKTMVLTFPFFYFLFYYVQILHHLGLVWDLRWTTSSHQSVHGYPVKQMACPDPVTPTMEQVFSLVSSGCSLASSE